MNVSGQNFNYCASQTSIEYSITDQPWRADKQTMILAKFGKKYCVKNPANFCWFGAKRINAYTNR